jgi:hypothetical protein
VAALDLCTASMTPPRRGAAARSRVSDEKKSKFRRPLCLRFPGDPWIPQRQSPSWQDMFNPPHCCDGGPSALPPRGRGL